MKFTFEKEQNKCFNFLDNKVILYQGKLIANEYGCGVQILRQD